LPDPDEAARTVVPAYLAAYGPATPAVFDAWLLRGATPKARLRRWFADLVADGALTEVEVDGERRYARTRDVDDLLGQGDADGLRLLGPFDPYVLGPGTNDPDLVPPAHRRAVSRAAGWIARVVLDAGRVVGTWTVEDDRLTVAPFDEPVAPAALAGERVVWSRVLGRELTVPV
jgi:Winged helix DNA-binding domain